MYTTVRLTIGRSRTLLGWLCIIHSVAFLSAISLSISSYTRIFLVMLVMLSLAHTLKQHYFRTAGNSVRAVILRPDRPSAKPAELISDVPPETWQLELNSDQPSGDGEQPLHAAKMTGSYLVTPWLVLLNFRIEGRLRTLPVLLFSDATDAEKLRQLRVRLSH